jgi:nitrogen fixation protein NifQ
MEVTAIYDWLVDGSRRAAHAPADTHVVASVIAMAVQEARSGSALSVGVGLAGAELRDLLAAFFPQALSLLERFNLDEAVLLSEDERCLRELLVRHATHDTPFETWLASMIARRSMRPNHLWQDLGLCTRHELSDILRQHFASLAARNNRDMKWKKFFYRLICRDEGFHLCTAPSCSECDDFAVCFGDESGESMLAHIRRAAEMPASHGLLSVPSTLSLPRS